MQTGEKPENEVTPAGPQESQRLSVDKHCDMLTAHIRDRNAAITDGFKLFVQMFSALVGGAVIARLQYGVKIPSQFASLASGLAALIVCVCAIIILENVRSWFQYRKTLSKVAGVGEDGKLLVPPPKIFAATRIETVMLVVMVIACILFFFFNPLVMSADASPVVSRIYPADVQTFTERVAMCATAQKEHLVLPEKFWACDKLDADRKPLLIRYRGQPELLEALNGHWVVKVERVQTHIQN